MHAVLGLAKCYDDFSDLDKILWDNFFTPPLIAGYSKMWKDNLSNPTFAQRKAIRQAEFLVSQQLPINIIKKIGVQNSETENIARTLISDYNLTTQVEVLPGWYY